MAGRQSTFKSRHALKVLSSLDNLRAWGWVCDFEIRVGREAFSVHRTVLAACSLYFQKLFTQDSEEARKGFVEVLDADVRAVRLCIEFMYSGEALITLENVQHVLPAAGLFQLDDLTELCLDYLKDNVTFDTCLYIRRMCIEYHCVRIKASVERYITENLEKVVQTEGFQELTKEEILHYLKLPDLGYEMIWEAVITWVKSSLRERKKHLFELLSPNFTKFQPGFLIDTLWKEPLIQQSRPIKDMLVVVLFSDVEALKKSITVDNCFAIKELCEGSSIGDRISIYNETKLFLMRHFEEMSVKPEFAKLTKDEIFQIFRSPKTKYTTEVAKWNAALKWVNHDRAQRKRFFLDLFRTIKLENLHVDFINDVVRTDPLTVGCKACLDVIIDALVHHAADQSQPSPSPSRLTSKEGKRVPRAADQSQPSPSPSRLTSKEGKRGPRLVDQSQPLPSPSKVTSKEGKKRGHLAGDSPARKVQKKNSVAEEYELTVIEDDAPPQTYIAVLYRDSGQIKGFDLGSKWKPIRRIKNSQEDFFSIVALKKNLHFLDGVKFSLLEEKSQKQLGVMKWKPSKEAKAVAFRDSIHVIDSNRMAWFSPSANTWTERSAVGPFGEGFCVTANEDYIYILGGSSDPNRGVRYTPAIGFSDIAPMAEKRVGSAAAMLGEHVFVMGGLPEFKNKSAEKYDPVTDSWTYIKPMLSERAYFCACGIDDKLYVLGGSASATDRFDAVEVYQKDKGVYKWKILHHMMKVKPPFSVGVISAKLP